LLVSCGSDDGSSTSSDAPITTESAGTGAGASQDAAEAQPGESTFGTLTLRINGDTISAEITECANDSETQVAITAGGETSQVLVQPAADNRVAVAVSGAVEFEGVGDAVVSDAGAVSITGTGAPADPSAPTADFSIEAQINRVLSNARAC